MSKDIVIPEIQEAIEELFQVRRKTIEQEGIKFSHYTSAHVATSIIQKNKIWMRNASVMNDFSEVEWGLKLLKEAWPEAREEGALDEVLSSVSGEYPKYLKDRFYQEIVPKLLQKSFILSLSEHGGTAHHHETKYGRLSMWRAYGGDKNLALIINSDFAFETFWGSRIFLLPVEYVEQDDFSRNLRTVCDLIAPLIKDYVAENTFDSDRFANSVLWWLQMLVLSTKHPGFKEEREWRAIYFSETFPEKFMKSEVVFAEGVPQEVYMLSTLDDDGESRLEDIVEQILIGPSQFPKVMQNAMVRVLVDAGFEEAEQKVQVSSIPLRR